jgi:hypothetical protein
MIYREDSIKNLLNNSIVRYNDPAVLEVSKDTKLIKIVDSLVLVTV